MKSFFYCYVVIDMEIRRVQVTGGASFVVTLPKEWAEGQKIRKNDPVGMTVQPDGTLLISKNTTDEILEQIKEIDCTTLGDPAFLFRLLIGTYIMGFTMIRLTSKQGFPPSGEYAGDISETVINLLVEQEGTSKR